MKLQILIASVLFVNFGFAQNIPQLEPSKVGPTLDFSPEFIARFNSPEAMEDCSQVYEKMRADGRSFNQLTEPELRILRYCDEVKESVWDIVGGGCSWYCGGGPKKVTASSYLASSGAIGYEPKNAHDLNYQYAWVEGVDGNGLGEYLEYDFDPESPRITEIIVVNGYVKNQSVWSANGRVKKLRVYYNDVAIADLNLKDLRAEQRFRIEPVGHGDRSDFDLLKQKSRWKLKFEILEVYEGSKYSDTVISEIYFNGLDVH